MGFGGECGGSRAPRADGLDVWVWNRRFEQLARMERDWAAHTSALETADAVVKALSNGKVGPRQRTLPTYLPNVDVQRPPPPHLRGRPTSQP